MAAEMLKIAGMAILAVSAGMILRQYRPEMAVQVSLAAGIIILAYGLEAVLGIRDGVEAFLAKYGVSGESAKAIFKIIGIAYMAQFASDICRDCGENAVASKVELAGRVMMIVVAFPLIISTMDGIGGLMGQ